ncbi:uncharacterized protein Dvar_78490 [Desulfosarcina variabilis str. Montpellier]
MIDTDHYHSASPEQNHKIHHNEFNYQIYNMTNGLCQLNLCHF